MATYAPVTSAFVSHLKDLVGAKNVGTSDVLRDQHGRDESYHTLRRPDVVVFPQSVEHVSAVVKKCAEEKIPVIPFGTGTGLEGGITAIHVSFRPCCRCSSPDRLLPLPAQAGECECT
jgi:D-lactate dehydrogenase (cytochrome)